MAKKNQKIMTARYAYSRLWRDWLKEHYVTLGFTFILMIIVAISAAGYAKFIQIIISAFESLGHSYLVGPIRDYFFSLG